MGLLQDLIFPTKIDLLMPNNGDSYGTYVLKIIEMYNSDAVTSLPGTEQRLYMMQPKKVIPMASVHHGTVCLG